MRMDEASPCGELVAVVGGGRYNHGKENLLTMDKCRSTRVPLVKGPAWKAAEAYGCDMSLVEANLELTPLERIRRNDWALATTETLRKAVERRRARA